MNGARSLVETLLAADVEVCFANPGTSEMHFVAALDQVAGIRCVLGLQENVVTGMADGYFRIARKPACKGAVGDPRGVYRFGLIRKPEETHGPLGDPADGAVGVVEIPLRRRRQSEMARGEVLRHRSSCVVGSSSAVSTPVRRRPLSAATGEAP